MATNDLITSAYADLHLPANPNASLVSNLITACSRAIQRYCRRWFVSMSFDELYNGNADRRLLLRNYPIQAVQSVRYRPVTVLKITNNLANTPQARVQVTNQGITLLRVTSGVAVTDATLTFASNVTIVALQNAVNALGNAWSAAGVGYDQWPSADLYCPNGPVGDPYFAAAGQGNLQCVAGSYAELKMHTYELQGYQYDARQGWLLRAIPYSDPELLHPEDLIFPPGINNFRVQYTAGFTNIPDDLQEACAEWVAYLYNLALRDPALQHQVPGTGTTSGWVDVFSGKYGPPGPVRAILNQYKEHRISIGGG